MAKKDFCVIILLFVVISLGIVPVLAQDNQPESSVWDGESRFTVLVLGIDRRPSEGATISVRTDVVMLVSIDPETEKAGILVIPRDTHMAPPGADDFVRVNSLLGVGERLQDGYGPYYVMDTVQYNLGLYIDRYIIFDFEAFIAIVDALGGIEITIEYAIYDSSYPDMNYGYDPFSLRAGTHLLNGYDTLRFARTRHADSDFMRSSRQLQVVKAIFNRVSQRGLLPSLIMRAPQLFETIENDIYTDLTLDEMIQFASYGLLLDEENISTGSLNEEYNMTYALPNGRSVYIPDRSRLLEMMTKIFGANYSQ
jgi:polyisoprenyl-teichoic acid--peptidoglycan teichoic acid transferase